MLPNYSGIKLQNANTGEIIKVNHVGIVDGRIYADRGTARFFNAYGHIFGNLGRSEHGVELEILEPEVWHIMPQRKRRTKDEMRRDNGGERLPDDNEPDTDTDDGRDNEPQPVPQPTPQPATTGATFNTATLNADLSTAFMGVFANVAATIEANVRANVEKEMAELRALANSQARKIEVISNGERHEIKGVVCADFEDILRDVNDGYAPYLYGAAGCGKTHTAEQVAEALGLEFYAQTTIQFAHDVRGYGDAAGRYVDTPFYKAFSGGGLFFQDEYDRSVPEAAVVLNSALANGWYEFPVVGRVKAHPKFRFMAAGNTAMTGADNEYTTAQTMDASSRDRVIYYEMAYDRRVEIQIARDDAELVDFIEDVRQSIAKANISHVVSYRETKYMKDREDGKEKALRRSTFKGLENDEIRIIYGGLNDTTNAWAKATRKLFA